jgi:hypothetical protein
MSSTSVPDNHVWLVLVYESDLPSSFYLQIPLEVINALCLRPRKYLLYLGWCVLGIEGVLAVEPNGNEIVNEGGLDNQGVYYFVTPDDASARFLFTSHFAVIFNLLATHGMYLPINICPGLLTLRSL